MVGTPLMCASTGGETTSPTVRLSFGSTACGSVPGLTPTEAEIIAVPGSGERVRMSPAERSRRTSAGPCWSTARSGPVSRIGTVTFSPKWRVSICWAT
jgi:hypothetical protein